MRKVIQLSLGVSFAFYLAISIAGMRGLVPRRRLEQKGGAWSWRIWSLQ
jgi:hypothetical protein